MDNNKPVIIFLVLILLLFFMGLATGLVPKKNQGVENKNSREEENNVASEYGKGGWMKIMDSLMSPFATKLDVNRLKFTCNRSGKSFTLTQSTPSCKITIPESSSDDYRKGSLRLKGQGAKVEIEYKPADEEAEKFKWPSKNGKEELVRLVAFEDGGTVNLECLNCDEEKHRRVTVTFE